MKRLSRLVLFALLLAIPSGLYAADVFYDLPVKTAMKSSDAKDKLLNVPLFMAGQAHDAVADDLGEFTSNQRTNAFNKPKERACGIAFLSAVISLQKRAKSLGADAVVDVKSITKHSDLESETEFRCVAGTVVANVALTGTMVRFEH